MRAEKYEYGICNGMYARKHRVNLNVQFILWKKGDQKDVDGIGHTEDKWIDFEKTHWNSFEEKEMQECEGCGEHFELNAMRMDIEEGWWTCQKCIEDFNFCHFTFFIAKYKTRKKNF